MQDKRMVRLRTFPHKSGDDNRVVALDTLSPREVFAEPYMVVVDGVQIKDWDELLMTLGRRPTTEVVEIARIRPIVGG